MQQNHNWHIPQSSKLTYIRATSLFCAIAYPVWGLLYEFLYPNLLHNNEFKYFISFLIFLSYSVSKSTPEFIKHMDKVFLAFVFGVMGHIFYLFALNQFHPVFLFSTLFGFFVLSSVLSKREHIIAFTFLSLLMSFAFLAINPNTEQLIFSLALFTFTCVLLLQSLSRWKISQQLDLISNLADESPEPIMRFDLNGKLLSANEASEKLLNYWSVDVFKTMSETWINRFNSVYNSKKTINIKINIENDYYNLNIVPIEGKKSVNIYVSNISKLIEAHRKIEQQQIQNMHTAKLSELGVLAANIGHEINNPLAIIAGRAEQILSCVDEFDTNPELNKQILRKASQSIVDTSVRISKIIRSLKNISRFNPNDKMAKIDLLEVFADIIEVSKTKLYNESIELRQNFPAHAVYVEGLKIDLTQVFLNLINNAKDAVMKTESAWIELKIEESAHTVKVSITDSGKGIPEAVHKKMFEQFYTTKEVGKGTGLGLSLSKQIVEKHKGKIYYDSKNKNTSFCIEFPNPIKANSNQTEENSKSA